ncbi:RNA polymerase sigma factor region1.1 domain-containing protein, partial [Dankookia rubra]
MISNPNPDPPGKVLAMLDNDPAMPERYTPDLIERLPLDDVTTRLGELGIAPAMPDRVRELVEYGRGPAKHLISLLDSEENTDLAAVERRPLPEVIAALDRLGTNHAAGLERIREILDPGAMEVFSASAISLKATMPETTWIVEEHSKGQSVERPHGARLTAGSQQTTRRMANRGAGKMNTTESRDEVADSVLLDTMMAAVKKLITRGKERGYVTYDEINAALPQDQ